VDGFDRGIGVVRAVRVRHVSNIRDTGHYVNH
jgi:hypothetical protein